MFSAVDWPRSAYRGNQRGLLVRRFGPAGQESADSCPRLYRPKLIRIAQQQDIDVVLVQSDPDMESAADQLREQDTLVCIGGNTPDDLI